MNHFLIPHKPLLEMSCAELEALKSSYRLYYGNRYKQLKELMAVLKEREKRGV